MARGEILYFDDGRGTGFINGDDGNRYVFARMDLSGMASASKGLKVDFRPDGNRARDISALHHDGPRQMPAKTPPPPPPGPWGASAPAPAPTPATAAPAGAVASDAVAAAEPASGGPELSLFAYFTRCVSADYAAFRGRARRKEYWGFALFAFLWVALAGIVGYVVGTALGFDETSDPTVSSGLAGLAWLAVLLPWLSLMVRRLHDVGLTGWLLLLVLFPTLGSLIMLVFALIPSQKHPNKWGPVPDGIRPAVPA